MILKKLTAAFGRLDRETLELHEGLNVVSRPNESGKSTWCAFLLAMLYGVDTSERAARGVLPAKTRYKPWSGADMSGSIELSWQGRDLTIERAPQGRTPMGAFRAYETGSGLDADLPGDCGRVLLGVERSVYQRSGFIGQQALPLSADNALEARLQALVTSGDEAVSASRALRQLRDLRNRRRHNRTGLLPQAEAELDSVADALDDQARLGRDIMSFQARADQLSAERERLSRRLAAQNARTTAQRREQLEQARQEWEKREKNLREKERTVAGLPPLEELEVLLHDLDQAAGAEKALAGEEAQLGERPSAPACPKGFQGLDADEVRDQAETDAQRLSALRPDGWKAPLPALIALILSLALGAAGLTTARPVMIWIGFILAGASAVVAVLAWRRAQRIARERRAILERYGADDPSAIRKAASDHREALLLYAHQSEAHEAQENSLRARRAGLEETHTALLTRTAAVCPGAESLTEARDGVQRAVHLQKFYQAALREAQPARARFEALRDAIPADPVPEICYAPEEAEGDPGETADALARLDEDLRQVRSRLDQRRGRMEASGDPAALAARKEELTGRIEKLSREYAALEIAIEALSEANDQLQTRFSPQINQLAAHYMARMTGGRYDRVLLSRDLAVTAREAGDPVSRPLAALSAGTADQLYLAVRLAVSRLLLPPDAPLVLDDALAAFDDSRMAAAMELLHELSGERQIILFTCHSREAQWLERHSPKE